MKNKKFKAETEEGFNILETPTGFKLNKEMKAKLLEMQMNAATKGSAEMLKFLGIQYLGQSVNKQDQSNDECPLVFCYGEGTKDCPVHNYLEHIGEFGTERYKQFMRENYGQETDS